MHTSLDDVEFLARSSSRVEVLDTLRERPCTRAELKDVTDTSRVTFDRTLDDLDERNWLVRSDGRYEATSEGAFITTEIDRLRSRLTESEGNSGSAGVTSTESALDVVGFLARSSSRLTVLDAICESPRTRQELADMTDASRATLSRILAELEDREWVEGSNHRYDATQRGTRIVEAFTRFLANVAAAEALNDAMRWLPIDEFEFDLACLGDATVISADWDDPTKSIHHVAELVRNAEHARIVGPGATREVAATIRTLTVEREGTFEGVIDARAVETIREDEILRKYLQTILESGRASVDRHESDLPFFVVAIVDDTVLICGSEDRGPAHQAVETNDDRVLTWAESYVESAKANARPLDADDFTV